MNEFEQKDIPEVSLNEKARKVIHATKPFPIGILGARGDATKTGSQLKVACYSLILQQ
jgi:hypothetical protein